jgi:hypothetical protein
LLDEVQRAKQLEAFDPKKLAEAVAEDPAAGSPELLAALGEELDRFAEKAMRIRFSASTDAFTREFRTLFTTTITSYANDLPLLRGRVRAALSRSGEADVDGVSERVMIAAESVLGTLATLRQILADAIQRAAPPPPEPEKPEEPSDPVANRFAMLDLD